MSRPGEIKSLTKLINPHLGVITNIGEAHIENFRNIHGIARAKSEIIESIKPGGTIILNRDDKFYKFLYKIAKSHKLNIFTFGKNKKSDVRLERIVKKGSMSQIFINYHFRTEALKSVYLNCSFFGGMGDGCFSEIGFITFSAV